MNRSNAAGHILLTRDPFDTTAAVRALTDAAQGRCGAVVTFTGVVRADPHGGNPVERLEFECYPEMAEAELERVRGDAVERFGLAGCTVVHRHGSLCVGEEIVLVVAAAAHRRAAFDAAGWVMDEVKRRVPLWKREVGPDGTGRWVHGESCSCGTHERPA